MILATAVLLVAGIVGAQFVAAGTSPFKWGGDGRSGETRGTVTPRPDYQLEKTIPPGLDVFDLTLGQTRAFSAARNFKLLGHSYFKGPWITAPAREKGLGAGFNSLRVHDGIAYLAGYSFPPTVFGTLIVDVRNPRKMEVLSFIPCNPGARCNYLRLNEQRNILVVGNDMSRANPEQPPAGQPVQAGFAFYDVSTPRNPKKLGFLKTADNGMTHGFSIDDRYVYGCAFDPSLKPVASGDGNQELKVIDYADPSRPTQVSSVHIEGQALGETYAPNDTLNPDGSVQKVVCHEAIVRGDLVYVSWRDAGMVIVDVADRSKPKIVSRLDYVPPFNGGSLGASHTSAPVPTDSGPPRLIVQTDEIFDCPPGFGRIIDISNYGNPQILSSFRIPAISDNFDRSTGKFNCQEGLQSIHLPWFDNRSSGLLYTTWYDQGLRAWDISNPFRPHEIGYYISPKYATDVTSFPGVPPLPFFKGAYRASREVYQDDETGRIYMTDGNGGGLTVLEWTGRVPDPPLPGAR